MQSLLFQLCVEVNKVGAHALPRPTLQELLQASLNQALQQYHGLAQQPKNKVTFCGFSQNLYRKKNPEKHFYSHTTGILQNMLSPVIAILHLNIQLVNDMPCKGALKLLTYSNSSFEIVCWVQTLCPL